MYVLSVDGFAITEPMPLEVIVETFGSVKTLESNGVRVCPVGVGYGK